MKAIFAGVLSVLMYCSAAPHSLAPDYRLPLGIGVHTNGCRVDRAELESWLAVYLQEVQSALDLPNEAAVHSVAGTSVNFSTCPMRFDGDLVYGLNWGREVWVWCRPDGLEESSLLHEWIHRGIREKEKRI
jgi:hypothetical protein